MIRFQLDPDYESQPFSSTITIGNEARRVRFDFDYHSYTEKWYVGLYDMLEEKYYCSNIPVVASYGVINDLFAPYHYLNIGRFVCVPVVDSPSTEDPKMENVNEFELIWGGSNEW